MWQTGFDDLVGATLTIDTPVVTDTLTLSWLDDGRHSIPTEITITGDDGIARIVPVPPTEAIDGIATAVLPVEGLSTTRTIVTISAVDERTTPDYFSTAARGASDRHHRARNRRHGPRSGRPGG